MAATGLRFFGHGHPPLHRFRLGLEFVLSGHREVDGMIEHHAAIARMLGEQLELRSPVLDALGASYERWDGRGWPGDLKGEQVPLPSRIAQLAEYAEVAHRVGGVEGARRLALARRGKQFDPTIADLLVSDPSAVFAGLDEPSTWSTVIAAEPGLGVLLDDEPRPAVDLDDVADLGVVVVAVADLVRPVRPPKDDFEGGQGPEPPFRAV